MGKELLIGFHVSIKDSLSSAFDGATELGCTTFQIFTRNPRGWKFRPLDEEEVSSFLERRRQTSFKFVVAHMPYLPNLATPVKALMRKSRSSLGEEVKRCDSLGIDYLVAHIGSHMGKGTMVGVRNVAEACDEALEESTGKTVLLLENMAGQKNCVGARFEELRLILDLVKKRKRVGVCLDTCHLLAAGFDMTSKEAVERTMSLFDELVGLKEIRVVHLNDSKGPLGGALDRHEHIGLGQIGREGFRAFLHHDSVTELPLLMETPVDDRRRDAQNLQTVKRLAA
ncbi:MAG: deoxyribonuclease IV [Thaumarchaeota archaeon]|nr:MAG: deoxyribonuclease IV [Nitrososphaerota archaeon]TMP99309.1 MAG: deoxyribonuclease IV [Nitrososphaerota archaeon]